MSNVHYSCSNYTSYSLQYISVDMCAMQKRLDRLSVEYYGGTNRQVLQDIFHVDSSIIQSLTSLLIMYDYDHPQGGFYNYLDQRFQSLEHLWTLLSPKENIDYPYEIKHIDAVKQLYNQLLLFVNEKESYLRKRRLCFCFGYSIASICLGIPYSVLFYYYINHIDG